MSHHFITVKDLCYRYPEGTHALEDVSFTVTHGESVAVVGANGAGKSTLLLHLNGLLLPTQGSINVGGTYVNKKTLREIRKKVGFVFQNPDDQLFMPTVYDDVAFGPLQMGLSAAVVDTQVKNALKQVGALHLADRPPFKLSAGEKRLAAMAAILVMQPDILVMDEPTSSLDPLARRNLIRLLKSFKHTKIIATHDLDMVLEVCRRTLVLCKGKLTADAPPLEVFNNNKLLKSSHLEKPLTMQGCPVCAGK
ncbi:MAG: energy-coupling factor ABC transporter ATP-binding protein [Spirochaetia bacterium]